jgi:glycosyltransferase involved in cell wall biosynthesis
MLSSEVGSAGFIVELSGGEISEDQLAENILRFAKLDSDHRDDLRARARSAAEKFDFDTMIDAFKGVYESVAAQSSRQDSWRR